MALRYGYHRYQADVMMITIVLLVIIVCIIQIVFDHLASLGGQAQPLTFA